LVGGIAGKLAESVTAAAVATPSLRPATVDETGVP